MQRYSLAFVAAGALLAVSSAAWAANGSMQGVKVVSATDDTQQPSGPLCRNANGTQISCFHSSKPTKDPAPHRHHHAPPEPPSAPATK